MDENFDIELNEENSETSNVVQLPMNFLLFGEIENDDVKVYIKQDVYKALEKYALEDTDHERGTIILGDYSDEMGKTHVIISNYIEAKYTDASASTLTFTHETWDYVHKEQDAKYPDKKIVGWQHTHPSYGIFLSNYDLFIQENFFNLPFQIAYVIDPVQNLRGFFQWKNGKIEKLKGFYVYDDIGKPIKIEQIKKTDSIKETPNKDRNWFVIAGIVFAILFSIANFVFIEKTKKDISEYQERQVELEMLINSQNESLLSMEQRLKDAEASSIIDQLSTAINELTERLESERQIIDNQKNSISELETKIETLQDQIDQNEDEFIVYTIQPGDTLSKICSNFNINYWANRKVILGINGIKDENLIIVGQTLIFPKRIQTNE